MAGSLPPPASWMACVEAPAGGDLDDETDAVAPCEVLRPEGAVEQQGHDRTVDQTAAIGGLRALVEPSAELAEGRGVGVG